MKNEKFVLCSTSNEIILPSGRDVLKFSSESLNLADSAATLVECYGLAYPLNVPSGSFVESAC